MSLEDYLQRHYRPATVKLYRFEIGHYLDYLGEAVAIQGSTAETVRYLAYQRERGLRGSTLNRILYSIKAYYHYLVASGQRAEHPCVHLTLRDGRAPELQLQDLLSEAELRTLLQREERFARYARRNQLVLSLLIHQALRPSELVALLVGDVDLPQAKLYVREQQGHQQARTLPLVAEQILLLHEYLSQDRPCLLKQPAQVLILSGRGRPYSTDSIHYLVATQRQRVPTKKVSPATIRQSVIANKLKSGEDLRRVQLFVGHRQPSTTERYRHTQLEALRRAVERFHPRANN